MVVSTVNSVIQHSLMRLLLTCVVLQNFCSIAHAIPKTDSRAITLQNSSKHQLTIWILRPNRKDYDPPITIPGHRTVRLKQYPPGQYYIVARLPDGNFIREGWKNYTSHKITYKLVAVVPMMSQRYWCPTCRRWHNKPVSSRTYVWQSAIYRRAYWWCAHCRKHHTTWVTDSHE